MFLQVSGVIAAIANNEMGLTGAMGNMPVKLMIVKVRGGSLRP